MPFDNTSDHDIITKSAAVMEAFTPEKYAYLLSLLPTPETLGELHSRFEASYAASLKGDPEKIKACEADRMAIKQNLNILVGLAKAVTPKDPTVQEALGLGHAPERTAAASVTLGNPHGFKVVFDPQGRMFASVTKLQGAKGYQLWACDGDPAVDANWRLVASSVTCKRIAIMGLNRSKTNWFRIRGMRGNSAGPWSNYISLNPA